MDQAAFLEVMEMAGPVAAGIFVVLATLFAGLKWSGFGAVFGDKKKLVGDEQIAAVQDGIRSIKDKMDEVESRMSAVEHDVEKRATREEMHQLELAFTRMEGRFESVSLRVESTANGVNRIEEFMYEAALRAKGER